MSGKGSKARPYSVDHKTFANNWDAIFRKDPREIEDNLAEDEEFARISANTRQTDGKTTTDALKS